MTEVAWQRDLTELRQLMRNEVTNHERIRTRVLTLRERYVDGEMGDSFADWTRWAVAYFAYSPKNLKRLSSPHPLSLDKWQQQQQAAQAKFAREQQTQIASQAQTLWDEIQFDSKRAQAAWDRHWQEQEAEEQTKHAKRLQRIKKQTERAKAGKIAQALDCGPPNEAAVPYLMACAETERKSRIELGQQYQALKDLADQRLLGRNPQGKHWFFTSWCAVYIRRSRRDILKCITEFHESKNGASCPISPDENVVQFIKTGS